MVQAIESLSDQQVINIFRSNKIRIIGQSNKKNIDDTPTKRGANASFVAYFFAPMGVISSVIM